MSFSVFRGAAAAAAILTCAVSNQSAAAEPAPAAKWLGQDDVRLATIGYRLSRANGADCERPTMLTGLVLHDLSQYEPSVRPRIMSNLSLGGAIGVLGVVPGSPAWIAGIAAGDQIVAVDGQDVTQSVERLPARPSFDRIAAVSRLIQQQLTSGSMTVTIKRRNGTFAALIAGERGCGGEFNLEASGGLDAWSDGRNVVLSGGLMDFAASDDEIAFVAAHEMAHNILGHVGGSAGERNGMLASYSPPKARIKNIELQADYHAIALMRNAGYDPQRAVSFLERSSKRLWWAFSLSHPGFGTRIRTVEAAMAESRPVRWSSAASVSRPTFRAQAFNPAS